MITPTDEYLSLLAQIQDHNFPVQAILAPSEEHIHEVDLATRSISMPQFLSVEADHKSETIYFRVDRFFDYMDLARTACVIQYINARGESHFYPVPFYDCITENEDNKMLVPWNIDGSATVASGTVQFNIRFYLIENGKFIYNLTTKAVSAKVLHGMGTAFKPEDYEIALDKYLQIQFALKELNERVVAQLYWLTPDTIETATPDIDDLELREKIDKIFDPPLSDLKED